MRDSNEDDSTESDASLDNTTTLERPASDVDETSPDASAGDIPVVTLGETGKAEAPVERLLQGRIALSMILYPCYFLVFFSGVIATQFAVESPEWSSVPVAVAWFLLFVWYWFYGVAYRYRRRVLKYTSLVLIVLVSLALGAFAVDRGVAQIAFDGEGLRHRGPVSVLYWSTVFISVAWVLLLTHVLFLGRGYRRKRE